MEINVVQYKNEKGKENKQSQSETGQKNFKYFNHKKKKYYIKDYQGKKKKRPLQELNMICHQLATVSALHDTAL